MSYRVAVTVIHTLGQFRGFAMQQDLSFEEAQDLQEKIESRINLIDNLTIVEADDVTSISFPEDILRNSVLKLRVVER
jgi:hypothetical protein